MSIKGLLLVVSVTLTSISSLSHSYFRIYIPFSLLIHCQSAYQCQDKAKFISFNLSPIKRTHLGQSDGPFKANPSYFLTFLRLSSKFHIHLSIKGIKSLKLLIFKLINSLLIPKSLPTKF